MDETTVWAIVGVVALLVVALVIWAIVQRRRSTRLQGRFGSEYDRMLEETGGRREAEAELREREQRRRELDIVPLDPAARTMYAEDWRGIQERFVDSPAQSVAEADVLVMRVMRDRGYPIDDFDRRAADISVDHPDLVDHFRDAHAIAERSHMAGADTEQLREAVVHYRALFEALLDGGADVDVDLTDGRGAGGPTVDLTNDEVPAGPTHRETAGNPSTARPF